MKSQADISLKDIHLFSNLVLDYVFNSEKLVDFFELNPSIEGVLEYAKKNTHTTFPRTDITEIIGKQYHKIGLTDTQKTALDKIENKNTFFITTAHQPCVLGGPLYTIIKMCSAIKLAQIVNKKQTTFHFIPLYVLGSEDHDLEETNHVHLFSKKTTWNTAQTGAVGSMKVDDSFFIFLEEVKQILGTSFTEELDALFTATYTPNQTIAKAQQIFLNHFFKEYGALILDLNEVAFKQLFVPCIEKEFKEQTGYNTVINTTKTLSDKGYTPQAYPRDYNFFYLNTGIRERFLVSNEEVKVNNTDAIPFPKASFWEFIKSNPEHFSPNVIYRPLYQQLILPNACYVGGGGEISYWLELKNLFDIFNISYPVLMLRDHFAILDEKSFQRFLDLGFTAEDLFSDLDVLYKKYIGTNSESLNLEEKIKQLDLFYSEIKNRLSKTDKTLEGTVDAEFQKALNGLRNIETKYIRAEKKKEETTLAFIEKTKEKIFPTGTLQERVENVLPFYIKYNNQDFIKGIIEKCTPFSSSLHLLS